MWEASTNNEGNERTKAQLKAKGRFSKPTQVVLHTDPSRGKAAYTFSDSHALRTTLTPHPDFPRPPCLANQPQHSLHRKALPLHHRHHRAGGHVWVSHSPTSPIPPK